MKIIDGGKIAQRIKEEIKKEIKKLGFSPSLGVILIGKNKASEVFVRQKAKTCKEVGINFHLYRFPKTVSQEKVERLIQNLNLEPKVQGVVIQLPLPPTLDSTLLDKINPKKDIDCLTSLNFGRFVWENPLFPPPTAQAVEEILKEEKIEIKGKNITVVGAGRIAGLPIALFFLQKGGTVTLCHKFSRSLKEHTKKADVLISATGQPNLIKGSMVKKEAVVIDVGVSWKRGRIRGDVNLKSLEGIASKVVPVPRGVGPVTVACLLRNTVFAAKLSKTNPFGNRSHSV